MSSVEAIQQALVAGNLEKARAETEEYIGGIGDENPRMNAIGRMLSEMYREFHIAPVHGYVDEVVGGFPEQIARGIREPVEPDLELTRLWQTRLDEAADERLSNELIEHVKANNSAAVEQGIVSLLKGVPEDKVVQRARYIGNTLGGLVHERERAAAIVKAISKAPMKYGIDFGAAIELDQQFQESVVQAARRERPVAASARTNLTQAIVELSRTLPARNVMHEAGPEDSTNFDRNVRAIFRCCLMSHGHNKYHEATMLIVEFSPKEVSSTGALAGVEQRLFGTLGRTARAVATKVLAEVGANDLVFKTYFDFAKKNIATSNGKYMAEALGLLKNPGAVPFLVDTLHNRHIPATTETIFALGTIADDRAQRALLAELQKLLGVRNLEGSQRREVFALIGALARASRQVDAAGKKMILAHVIKALPKNDTELAIRVALSFFTGKLEEFDPMLLSWAAKVATMSLWNIDRPELARAARTSPLGFRQPLLDTMQRLAPYAMPAINQTALEQAKTYNGAYLAMGEFYAKAGDETALPVLRQLLMNTFLHDDTKPQSAYMKETVLDTATDERSEISRDKVLASLIYAVDKIGGDEAQEILADIFEQIQAGRLPKAGPETSDILVQASMRNKKRAGQALSMPGAQPAGDGAAGASGASQAQVGENDLQLLRELEASYLIQSKRRAKKVSAMAQLAQRKFAAAIPVIVPHLTDKDPIVASAALTSLMDFGSGSSPAPVQSRLHEELFRAMVGSDNALRVKVAEVLKKINPGRSPLKERLAEFAKQEMPLPARAIVSSLVASSAPPKIVGAEVGNGGDEDGGGGAKEGAAVSQLEKKRMFLLARQEWIRGGKRGQEPKME